jgi:hypothetical protein
MSYKSVNNTNVELEHIRCSSPYLYVAIQVCAFLIAAFITFVAIAGILFFGTLDLFKGLIRKYNK